MNRFRTTCLVFPLFILLTFPASTNYMLRSYDLDGAGGVGESPNYKAETNTAPVDGGQGKSANYSLGAGLAFSQQSHVPTATLVNSSSWYNKLLLTINTENNPTDTLYAVAVSTDNFATTNYVQNDGTIGSSLGSEDWQTYASWGDSSGTYLINLSPGTTYYVKVTAKQGDFTQSPYGPVVSAATSNSTLSFDIDVASTDTESSAPYSVDLGALTAGSVTTASNKIWIDLATNAADGGFVYLYDAYSGLKSSNVNYTIDSSTANLASATEGYGLQVATTSNLTAVSPYDGSSESVGGVDGTIRTILNSGNAPVTAGRSSISVKAKSANNTPAANDYADQLTLIASGSF